MREIKFRAWDKVNKEWANLVLGAGGQFICMRHESGDYEDWQQYTGLKDKNGKEIYEGDIIGSSKSRSTGLIKDIWTFEWLSIEMEDGKMESGKNALDRFHHLKDMKGVHRCSVIGNIYENPELLPNITSDK